MKNGGSFHSFLLTFTRGYPQKNISSTLKITHFKSFLVETHLPNHSPPTTSPSPHHPRNKAPSLRQQLLKKLEDGSHQQRGAGGQRHEEPKHHRGLLRLLQLSGAKNHWPCCMDHWSLAILEINGDWWRKTEQNWKPGSDKCAPNSRSNQNHTHQTMASWTPFPETSNDRDLEVTRF